ncbi:MAG: hypothetical protein IJW82_07050 [Clostridia bacterium]|nr:hypothetical protein [Clostridia bacterium]
MNKYKINKDLKTIATYIVGIGLVILAWVYAIYPHVIQPILNLFVKK